MTCQFPFRASAIIAYGFLVTIGSGVAAPAIAIAATHRTDNFVATASTEELARKAAETAEACRKSLAISWLGEELDRWSTPCPITVDEGPQLGQGGATTFVIEDNVPGQWRMRVQGTRERLLDSAIPHEVLHAVLATHFGRPVPRWADEGAAISAEHSSEKAKYDKLLRQCLVTGRGIPFNDLLNMSEYPTDITPFVAQSASLVKFLTGHDGGRSKFIQYVRNAMDSDDWATATRQHYGYDSLGALQIAWTPWVAGDAPPQRPVAQAGPVTVSIDDVIRMAKANVDSAVVERYIRKHQLAAPLTADDLILLTENGVNVSVITALQDLPVMAKRQANQYGTVVPYAGSIPRLEYPSGQPPAAQPFPYLPGTTRY